MMCLSATSPHAEPGKLESRFPSPVYHFQTAALQPARLFLHPPPPPLPCSPEAAFHVFILATSGSFLPHWDKPVGPPKCRQQKPTAARAISWDSSTAETLKSALPQELRLTAPLAPPGAAADAQRGRSRHRIYCSTRPNTKAFACKRIN